MTLAAGTAPSSPGGIDTSVIVAIIALVGSIGGIVIANRYTSRNARDAAAKSVIVEQSKLDESRRQNLMDNMQEEITRLNEMRKADRIEFEQRLAETNLRLTELMTQHDNYRRDRVLLQQQVDSLVLWSRSVIRILRGAELQYPPPPPGAPECADRDRQP
jgi:hypothetical protein